MKKRLCFLLLIISIVFCGCWGYAGINEYNILYGVGFDLNKDKKYEIVTEGVSPVGTKGEFSKGSNSNYYSAIGESIFDAARNLTKNATGKRTFYQTCQVIGIGKNLCEAGITPVIDFFSRDPKRRLTNHPVIFDGYIEEFFSKNDKSSEPLSSKLISIIKQYRYTGYAVYMNLSQTISSSKDVNGTVLINKFKFKTSDKDKNNYEPVLDGTGVFYKNKLVGYFNSQETMVYNIVSKQIKNTILVVKKDNIVEPYRNITVELSKFKTKITPIIENDKYIMNVDINTVASMVEYSENDSFKEYNYKELESLVSKHLNDLVNKTYLKCKTEFKVDALGFGKYFSRKYKNISKMESEEWNDIFCNKLNLKLNIKINIVNTGSTIEKSD